MKHLWMTATALALCVIAADASAAPASALSASGLAAAPDAGLLVRVATESTATHHKRHKHAKATTATTHAKKGRRLRRHGHAVAETTSRHGRHHHAAAAASREIHSAAPAPVKVGRHDTLISISRKTGVSVEELARLNGLKKPYHVRLGERIKLPARRYYVVKSGETLYSLARRFGVEASELIALNALGHHSHVRAGQKLYLPAGAAEAEAETEAGPSGPPHPHIGIVRPEGPYTTVAPTPYAPPSAEGQSPPASGAPATPGPAPNNQGFQLAPPPPSTGPAQPGRIIQASPPPSSSDVMAAGRGKFVWPVQGSVISPYGPKPDGQRNDGVNISANAGDPVRAAADGEVVYAGDQVPSFGNLVLIKHAGGWVTAYAHMSKILVKNRDQVVQGQEIGDVGQSGQVPTPQLHFEIRYAPSAKDKAVPIDPMLVLPQR